MELTRLWREIGRSWMVQVLVMTVALLEPAMLLAQGRGGIQPPITAKPPYVTVGPVDPILDAIQADIAATTKDANRNGLKESHTKRQAGNLRTLAKHVKAKGLDQQIKDWANAQDPDVFQFQQPDPKAVEAALATRKAQGLPTDDILAALNVTPEQRRALLLSLRENGLSKSLDENADLLDRANVDEGGYAVKPVQHEHIDNAAICLAIQGATSFLMVASVVVAMFVPGIGLIVGLAIAFIGMFVAGYYWGSCVSSGTAVPRKGLLPLSQKSPVFRTLL